MKSYVLHLSIYIDAIVFIGIDFHIGLPLEQNYRVSRYFTGLKPFRSFLRSLQDPHNREFMWKWTTGEARIQEVVDNAKSIIDVSHVHCKKTGCRKDLK